MSPESEGMAEGESLRIYFGFKHLLLTFQLTLLNVCIKRKEAELLLTSILLRSAQMSLQNYFF